MNYVWHDVNIDDILEAQELARSRGKVAGQDYTEEFLEVMAKKGIKPSGATELNRDELIQETLSHGKKNRAY
jgi:hypothetical protein